MGAYDALKIGSITAPIVNQEDHPSHDATTMKEVFDAPITQVKVAFDAAMDQIGADKDAYDAWRADMDVVLEGDVAANIAAKLVEHDAEIAELGVYDNTPTAGSDIPATSGGIKTELDKKADLEDTVVKAGQARSLVVTKTESFTLALTDAEKTILINSSSAIVITVPLETSVAFLAGHAFHIIRIGTGTVSFTFTSGITSHVVNSTSAISAQNASAELVCLGSDSWWLACG